ncbi:MAG: nucleotidyltransferase family protein [Amaricoccus sp.]
MSPRAAMIFAAGLGTRMGALTRDRPKPLIPVAGRPLIEHALALVREAAIPRLVVNSHAHADQLARHLAAAAPEARIAHEPVLLETGGGLKAALPLLGPGPVFTLNADMVWGGPNPLAALAQAWDPARMGALLCLVPRAAALGHAGPGDFHRAADGRLARRAPAPEAQYIYAGAQILDPAPLASFPEAVFSLNPLWDRLIAEGRLYGIVHPGLWVDVGRPEGIALAEAALAR